MIKCLPDIRHEYIGIFNNQQSDFCLCKPRGIFMPRFQPGLIDLSGSILFQVCQSDSRSEMYKPVTFDL